MSEVTDALRELQAGTRSIEDVEQMFRSRSWPKPAPIAKDGESLLKAELTDKDPAPEGSFSEVASAFYSGIITIDQYEVLAQAANAAHGSVRAPAAPPEGGTAADTAADSSGPETESAQVTDGAPKDTDADADGDNPEPGKPKKGVNPFPKKD